MENKGFTLIEMIVVIVILGVLAVTAAPRFMGLQSDARIATLQATKGAIESSFAMFPLSQKYRLPRSNLVTTTSKCVVWSLMVNKFG